MREIFVLDVQTSKISNKFNITSTSELFLGSKADFGISWNE